jgi:hypothetical protein
MHSSDAKRLSFLAPARNDIFLFLTLLLCKVRMQGRISFLAIARNDKRIRITTNLYESKL